jgi:membrane-anchored protein YejM (alkaline phosphatase superfamily)
MAKLHLSLLGTTWPMIWPMIEDQPQLRSAIQSRMTFLDFNEVNFGMLRLIVNVSFQVRHASTATIRLRSACSQLYSAHYILVCFILIMFSSALKQWTLQTHIVISQGTVHLGAGGSSCSPSANISIYA